MIDQATPELAAKAAVLNFLRSKYRWDRATVVISELELRSAGKRADLVATAPHLIAIEIKTHADKLTRLKAQAETYSRVFPKTYVALATRHLSRAVELLPETVGILEIICTHGALTIRQRRRAKIGRQLDPKLQLSMAPVGALKSLLRSEGHLNSSKLGRDALVELACAVRPARRVQFLTEYLSTKYRRTSAAWWDAVASRPVVAGDLNFLKAWPDRPTHGLAEDPDLAFFGSLAGRFGSQVFGPIPTDLWSSAGPEVEL